jgi:hypothetical protein
MKVETGVEQLYFTTVRLETEGASISGVGTAALVSHQTENMVDTDENYTFLVTNKHVIEGAEIGRFFFTRKDEGGNPRLGNQFNIVISDFEQRWTGHPSADVDIAVMPVGDILNTARRMDDIFLVAIPSTMIPTQETLAQLDAVEDVTFVGYPNGLFDRKNLLPVVRRGTLASPPDVDYDGLPAFIVDASVFPGSSGSPVFIFGPSIRHRAEEGLRYSQRAIFLGVVSSVFFMNTSGEIEFAPIPTSFRASFSVAQMIDVGFAFRSSTVLETIEQRLILEGKM